MSLGFTSLFGALFSKTWRVHVLFRDYKLKKTVSKICTSVLLPSFFVKNHLKSSGL